MRRLAYLLIFLPIPLGAQQIVLDIPDSDIKIVEHDVPSAEEWIRAAWAGKLSNCRKRMVQDEIKKSITAGNSLPAGESAIIQQYMSRTDYQSRSQRDAKEAKPK